MEGGLQSSCLRPWAFKDKQLENLFQKYMSVSMLERNKLLILVLVCCGWAVRLIHLALRLVFPYEWTSKEIIIMIVRLSLHTFLTLAVLVRMSESSTVLISKLLVWVPRIGSIATFAEQAGVQQDDSAILLLPLGFTIVCSLTSSFRECASFLSVLFLIKPASILLMGSNGCPSGVPAPCPGRDFQSVLIQNACLFCISIAVYYHIFSDTRRHWLLSFEMFGTLNELGPASAAQLTKEGVGDAGLERAGESQRVSTALANGEEDGAVLDLEQDGYFPPEERAEQVEAWRRERAEMLARDEAARGRPAQGWRLAGGRLGGRRRASG